MLTLRNPFYALSEIEDTFEKVFENPFFTEGVFSKRLYPSINLFEDKSHFILTAELPGLNKKDLAINLHQDTLSIEGEVKPLEQEDVNVIRRERFVGKFRRDISIPSGVDEGKVNAEYKDGVLIVELAKSEETKAKTISVK